jgi:hypothetical protein
MYNYPDRILGFLETDSDLIFRSMGGFALVVRVVIRRDVELAVFY